MRIPVEFHEFWAAITYPARYIGCNQSSWFRYGSPPFPKDSLFPLNGILSPPSNCEKSGFHVNLAHQRSISWQIIRLSRRLQIVSSSTSYFNKCIDFASSNIIIVTKHSRNCVTFTLSDGKMSGLGSWLQVAPGDIMHTSSCPPCQTRLFSNLSDRSGGSGCPGGQNRTRGWTYGALWGHSNDRPCTPRPSWSASLISLLSKSKWVGEPDQVL